MDETNPVTNMEAINAFTTIDEMMQSDNGPLMLLSPQQMFEMGQFYQWANDNLISDDEAIGMEDPANVPQDLVWVVDEVQGW